MHPQRNTLRARYVRSAKDVGPCALAQTAALRGRRRGGGGMVRVASPFCRHYSCAVLSFVEMGGAEINDLLLSHAIA